MFEPNFAKSADGLLPAVAQDADTGEILMLAYVNAAAWHHTLKTGHATYWSRSRNELWEKGLTSGHVQEIKEILVDCDEDAIVFKVKQVGDAACHTGYRSCFYRRVTDGEPEIVGRLVFDPKAVYGKKK
jgi:phosphoribosyl-AMP cyclohydrolase